MSEADLLAMAPDFATMGEPIKGETLVADGWVYRDIPWMSAEYGEKLIAIIGEDNMRLLAGSKRGNGDWRGQFMVSPAGLDNLSAYAKAKDELMAPSSP